MAVAANQSAQSRSSSAILLILGWLMVVLGVAMAIPCLADLNAGNPDWQVFANSALGAIFVGGVLVFSNRTDDVRLNVRQGALLTVASWLTIVIIASVPLALSNLKLSYADAFFEAMSGLTTTGSTVMSGLDSAPPGILLWRGMLQWMGGVGVVVMGMAILPFLRVGGMQLFRNESSDRTDRPVAHFRRFILLLLQTYVILTIACAVLLAIAGMTPFEAAIHSMTTISTGGFSTSDGSIGHFGNPAIEWIVVVFMIAGSVPFVLYIQALQGHRNALFGNSQVRHLVIFLIVVIVIMSGWLVLADGVAPGRAVRLAAFNIVSIVTTTGFATSDYSQWGTLPIALFFVLTFVGGCTGSTAGGIKIFRFQLLALMIRDYMKGLIYPHAVVSTRYEGRALATDTMIGAVLYICLFIVTVMVIAVILEGLGLELITAFTAAATVVGNVGPGLGNIIGPSGNFAALPDTAKWVLSIGMLLGRLEVFTVLLLFVPAFWRD